MAVDGELPRAPTTTGSGTSGRSTRASISRDACTLQTTTGPQPSRPCTTQNTLDFRRKLTMLNLATGKYLGALDEHTALGEQTYQGLRLERAAPRRQRHERQRQLHAVEVRWGIQRRVATTPNVNSGYVNPDDIDYDYGACGTDRRHVLNLTAGYGTPEFDNPRSALSRPTGASPAIYRVRPVPRLLSASTRHPAGTGIGGQRATPDWRPVRGQRFDDQLPQLRLVRAPGARECGRAGRGDPSTGPAPATSTSPSSACSGS